MIPGIKANTNRRAISTIKKGKDPRTICLKLRPEIEMAVNRLYPKGGVTKPTTKQIQNSIPRWSGLHPNLMPTGIIMGARIRVAAILSIKQPTISRIMTSANK